MLLAGWGCPIGELFDLEKLGEECKRLGRWSFFVTSEVCNVSRSFYFIFGVTTMLQNLRRSTCLEDESAFGFEDH